METVHYLYNGANQVACIDADANGACNGTEFWVYDAHGNLTFDRTTRYVYDAANHLATVCDSGDGLTCDALGNETTYQYNGDGARVAQSVRKGILPATVTTYTLDTALPLTQVLSETTNGQTTRYLHGLDLIAQSDGATTEYLAYDGLGSVRQLVDGSGTVLTSQTFDPYGTPYSGDEQAAGSFGFTGEQTDENGLVYLRARYYNPAQGRFMQVDPSRMERNGYQYAGSSPGMNTDPSGHCYSWLSWMRTALPSDICENVDTANMILSSPDTTLGQKALAFEYITVTGTGVGSGITGLSILGAKGVVAAYKGAGTAALYCMTSPTCTSAVTKAGEILYWAPTLTATEITVRDQASILLGTEPISPEERAFATDVAFANFAAREIWVGQRNTAALDDWMTTKLNESLNWNFSYGPGGPVGDSEELLQLMDYAEARRAYWVLEPGGQRPRYEAVARVEINGIVQYYPGQNGGRVAYDQLNEPLLARLEAVNEAHGLALDRFNMGAASRAQCAEINCLHWIAEDSWSAQALFEGRGSIDMLVYEVKTQAALQRGVPLRFMPPCPNCGQVMGNNPVELGFPDIYLWFERLFGQ